MNVFIPKLHLLTTTINQLIDQEAEKLYLLLDIYPSKIHLEYRVMFEVISHKQRKAMDDYQIQNDGINLLKTENPGRRFSEE